MTTTEQSKNNCKHNIYKLNDTLGDEQWVFVLYGTTEIL